MIIFLSMFSVLFIVLSIISLDFYTFYQKNVKVKEALNRGVKASALQLDTDAVDSNGNNLAGMGIFIINQNSAKKAFDDVIINNIGLDTNFNPKPVSVLKKPLSILEFKVLNDYQNMPYEYYSPTLNQKYLIKNPGVFCVCSFEIRSYFIKKEITFAKLSSAELINSAN